MFFRDKQPYINFACPRYTKHYSPVTCWCWLSELRAGRSCVNTALFCRSNIDHARLRVKETGHTRLCMIKILWWGAGEVTPSKPRPPYEQLLPLPTSFLDVFGEIPLKWPPQPTLSILHCYPLPIHHPFPPKNFDHTHSWLTVPLAFLIRSESNCAQQSNNRSDLFLLNRFTFIDLSRSMKERSELFKMLGRNKSFPSEANCTLRKQARSWLLDWAQTFSRLVFLPLT